MIGSLLFRSIRKPFHGGLSAKVLTAIVFSIYSLALISSVDQFYLYEYVYYHGWYRVESFCVWSGSRMLFVPLSIKSALLMNFIPLAVVVITVVDIWMH